MAHLRRSVDSAGGFHSTVSPRAPSMSTTSRLTCRRCPTPCCDSRWRMRTRVVDSPPNPRLDAPHSGVTALAQARKALRHRARIRRGGTGRRFGRRGWLLVGRPRSTAALPCSNCPRARRLSRGPRALRKPAVARKSYASSGLTRGPEGGTEMAQRVQPGNSLRPTPHRGAANSGVRLAKDAEGWHR
jgi:hypothetical protein